MNPSSTTSRCRNSPDWLKKVDGAGKTMMMMNDLDSSFLSSPSRDLKETSSWCEARMIVHSCQPRFSLMPSLYNRIKLEEDLGTFDPDVSFSVEREHELDLLR